ncbi:MAG TPA: segregation/condensation protein A [Opitutales bacterium]|nr:segregation/condensation protein A [Opitutales bacterium]
MTAPDTLATGQAESVHLPAFEGPLDLLLFLVRRSELDICDIPIALIADQYLDIIAKESSRRLDVAGEFLVMAATLMRIKSRMLLPPEVRKDAEVEDGEDPRWELAKMLLEYNRYKEAAGALSEFAERAGDRLGRLQEPEPELPKEAEKFDRFDLWSAYNAVMRRLAARLTEVRIEPELTSVANAMEAIRARLAAGKSLLFSELFTAEGPIPGILVAVNFLALLELARLGVATLRQDAAFSDIEISAPAPASVANPGMGSSLK